MCKYISEYQLRAKGRARECSAGAEVVALAAVSAVRRLCRGHIVCTPLLLLPIWLSIQKRRQRHVDKNLPAWYKR